MPERAEPWAQRAMRWSLVLLIFLSFFENGLTVLVNVKLRMIGFLILAVLSLRSLYSEFFLPGARLRGYEKAMLAWFAVGFLSALYDFRFGLEGDVAYGLVYNLLYEYAWILAYFAGKYAAARGTDFRPVFRWTLVFGFVVTAFAIFEKFFHTYIELFLLATGNPFIVQNFDSIFRRGYGYEESSYRCVSFVLEFIAFSYLCGVLALTYLVQFMETRRARYILGFLSSLAALFLTQSLSSLFACAIAICVYLFLIKRMSPGYLIWFGILAAAVVAALSLGKEEGGGPFEGIQNRLAGVASGRDEGLVTHFHDFQFGIIDNFTLFGHGMGTADFLHSSLAAEMERRDFPTIEHEYFRLIYEFGGVGFLFYLAAVALTAMAVWRFYGMFPDPWRKNLALTCCLWMLLYALVGFAHRSFPTYESSVFPALLLGYLGAEANREEAESS